MPNNVCFVDTACWISLLNKKEQIHHNVDTTYKQLLKNGYRFVTTSAVLNEVANSLSSPSSRSVALNF